MSVPAARIAGALLVFRRWKYTARTLGIDSRTIDPRLAREKALVFDAEQYAREVFEYGYGT